MSRRNIVDGDDPVEIDRTPAPAPDSASTPTPGTPDVAASSQAAEGEAIPLTPGTPGSTALETPTPSGPNLTPLRHTDGERWWQGSPLSVAVRRRRFLRPDLGRSITTTTTEPVSPGPTPPPHREPAFRRSNESLHTLDSLEIIGGPQADFEFKEKGKEKTPTTKVEKDDPAEVWPQDHGTPLPRAAERTTSTPQVEAGRGPPVPPKIPVTPSNPKDGDQPSPFLFPQVGAEDPRRTLKRKNLMLQRAVFGAIIIFANVGCLVGALLAHRHLWVLIVILFVKAKDILSTLIQVGWLLFTEVWKREPKEPDLSRKWILTCITAYAETEDQIMRTINSIIDNAPQQHNLAIAIILDGKPQYILKHFTKIVYQVRRPYQTWRFAHNEVNIIAGFMRNIPVLMIEKIGNAGKKDSLILCHDLFNHARQNVPSTVKEMRLEIWTRLLPKIIMPTVPPRFDFLFFTDADSLIYAGTLSRLVAALIEEPASIGACGLVLAEMTKDNAWSTWYLYQQFQYTFGQFVRRRAESIWGRVTCLPGCVTMIKVRPEMAGAIELYAKPVTDKVVFPHQVQYLGTDRRITWCMLEQSKRLKTLFVPNAISQTVAPQSFLHYMSQRRRWGSNAFFNDVYYTIGKKSWIISRLWALIDILRQTIVYYRLANTILFIYGLAHRFDIIKLVPYIVVTQTPAIWFLYLAIFHEPILRKQIHKLVAGWLINKLVSPVFSILIFTRIIMNLGNAVWGRTGASTHAASALDILHNLTPKRSWSPGRIGTLVRNTIKARTDQPRARSKLAMPLNPAGEPVPGPATEPMEEEPKREATTVSFATPVVPRIAHIPVNSTAEYGTVR